MSLAEERTTLLAETAFEEGLVSGTEADTERDEVTRLSGAVDGSRGDIPGMDGIGDNERREGQSRLPHQLASLAAETVPSLGGLGRGSAGQAAICTVRETEPAEAPIEGGFSLHNRETVRATPAVGTETTGPREAPSPTGIQLSLPEDHAAEAGVASRRDLTPRRVYPEQLLQAARFGVTPLVEALLGLGEAVNTETPTGQTPLHLTALNGHLNSMRALINAGTDVNATDLEGVTPLILAAQNGHEYCVEMLIFEGADVDNTDDSGNTALIYAASNGYGHCVNILTVAGADVNMENNARGSARSEASFHGFKKCENFLRKMQEKTEKSSKRSVRRLQVSYENISDVD